MARWIHFASIAVVFGASISALTLTLDVATLARTWRLLRAATLIAAASGVAWLAGTIANAIGGAASLVDPDLLRLFFFETPFGPPAMARILLFAALLILAVASSWPHGFVLAPCAVGAALLVSQAWLGHAAEGGGGAWGLAIIVIYSVHVLAASAWVGGLPVLAFVLAGARRDGCEPQRPLYDVLSRYSAMAILLVGLVVASGTANTVLHVRATTASIWNSPYVQILAVKLVLVGIMLALAACNRVVIMPRLRAFGDETVWLEASVGIEIVLSVFVLAAAAALGITAPPV